MIHTFSTGSESWCGNLLQAGGSRGQTLVGVRFSVPTQSSPGSHPAFYTVSIGGFGGGKMGGHGIEPPTSAKVRETVLPMWAFMARSIVKFTFTGSAIMQVFPFLNVMVLLSKLI